MSFSHSIVPASPEQFGEPIYAYPQKDDNAKIFLIDVLAAIHRNRRLALMAAALAALSVLAFTFFVTPLYKSVASVMLVLRHPQVSPWFPVLLLIYPVWETVFSVYRKSARGSSPGLADALHFHQLIYRRIVRGVFHDDESRRMLMRNNRTSPYLWGFTVLTVTPAVMFWQNTMLLVIFCVVFIISYLYAYISIVRFKVPRWLLE